MSMPPVHPQSVLPSELNIRDHLEIIRRRRDVFILVFLAALVVGIVSVSQSKPVYRTSAKLLVPASSYSLSVIDSNNPIGAMLAAAQPDSVDTQLQVLQSAPFLEDAERRAKIAPRPGVAAPSASAEAVENTNVIRITVTGGDPEDCAKLANAIVDLHLERTDVLTTTGLQETIQFVRTEKEKAEKQLAAAERKILQFRQVHQGADLSTEREARAGESATLLAQVLQAQANLTLTQGQMANLRARREKEPPTIRQANPQAARLQDKLDDWKYQRMELLRDFRPTSRQVQDLDGQIARLQQQLEATREVTLPNPARARLQERLEELEVSLEAQQQNYNVVAAQLKAKQEALKRLGPWEAELSILTRDRDAAQGAYTMLADRLRDLEIRKGARMRTARAIERASVPASPVPTHRTTNLVLAVVLAFLLAASTVFAQEYLDDRINSPDELQRISPLRPLAHVPLMGPDQPRLMTELPANSPAAESYRALRAAIGFAGMDAPIRRLQITSASPGEGKSTTAMNLAAAMARDGKKVILVDADMRAPSVHRYLDLPSSPGLSEALAGMKQAHEVLYATEIENLWVVPAGPIPPNPTELLGSPALNRVLERLELQADVLILDTPPCIVVTDPVLVAARMDGVVLVLHVGQTRRATIKQTIELLGQARARLIGVVYNKVQPHGSGYYYYYYYRSYPYYGLSTGAAPQARRHRRNGKESKPDLDRGAALTAGSRQSGEVKED